MSHGEQEGRFAGGRGGGKGGQKRHGQAREVRLNRESESEILLVQQAALPYIYIYGHIYHIYYIYHIYHI